jgi:hypothetical protein
VWNKLDMLVLAMYFAAIAVRLAHPADLVYQYDSKIILCINAIPLFFRLTRFYATSPLLGPKVLIV